MARFFARRSSMDTAPAAKPEPLEAEEHPLSDPTMRHIARIVLAVFLLTFIASRVLVILIMAKDIPDLFLHMGKDATGQTSNHVHHLNYGIFLLSSVGAYLLFRRPAGRRLEWAASVYAVGLALTFDEFGMWLHLGGSYWQRASFDAVVVIAAVLALLAYSPSKKTFNRQHWAVSLVIALAVGGFAGALLYSLQPEVKRFAQYVHHIEQTGPQ